MLRLIGINSVFQIQERSAVEQTILYAISLGGDTDTIATMAAAIAGAFYGLEAVPQAWQDSCEGVEDALMFGEKMAELISPGDAPWVTLWSRTVMLLLQFF